MAEKLPAAVLTIKQTAHGLTFSVLVQPRSSKAAIVGCHDNALKIKLTAPPVGGAANKQCIQILAKELGLPKSAVTITAGQTSKHKQVSLTPVQGNFSASEIQTLEKILRDLAGSSQ